LGLKKVVLPKLKNFREDITIHDRAALKSYQGDFISLYRDAGTHLFKCNLFCNAANWTYRNLEESLRLTYESNTLVANINQHYLLISKSGEYKHITKKEVLQLMKEQYERALLFYKNDFVKMNFEGMASSIEFFMSQYGKKWKNKLVQEWDSGNASPLARTIRNYFGMDFLKKIKFGTEKEEIKTSLINKYMEDK